MDEASISPAEGERRAIGGYHPQYLVSASLIHRTLRDGNLRWIRVADPEAGRVDDLQIGTDSRVDAYQVKWSLYAEPLRFRELTGPSRGAPGLIAQLADGWKRLKSIHTGHRIVVHLVTNRLPATSDRVITTDPAPTPAHTAAFIGQVWNQAKGSPPTSALAPPPAWQPAWDALQIASGLPPAEFAAFVADCELEFGYRLPNLEDPATRDEEVVRSDLKQLTHDLLATVAAPSRVTELTREQLLGVLGWRDRVEFRSRHVFPVEEALYEPIEVTVRELRRALDTLEGGYVALLGSPGSGKSTLLTHTLRLHPERIVRYYAYVPDAQDPYLLRGESESFLHDVVLAIERAGFRVGQSLSWFDRAQLLERLHEQLRLLHEDWLQTGRKTIILIDGLDHVARELRPQRSLLRDLPMPEQIPPGVLYLLGSQTDQLDELPDRVQHAIRQADRRIEMRPLTRQAVFRIAERAGVPVPPTDEQKEELYRLSAGHPLVLGLLINRLRGAADADAVNELLRDTEPYAGDIEAQYHSYWRQIENDGELVHLLGLLARLRGAIDLAWIEGWAGAAVVGRLRRRLSHYFRVESARGWYFFHNSFRLFIVRRTRETAPGVFDALGDQAFHRELADHCHRSAGRWAWEELYHRIGAEQHDLVLQRATPDWFRAQFLGFRPADAIEADIRSALRSVAARQDPIALTRLNFAAAEVIQRRQHLGDIPLVQLFLALGETDIAVEHTRDGNRLRVTPAAALGISVQLASLRLAEEARRLFEIAEPLDLLGASAPMETDYQDDKASLLEAWAEAASHFRELDEIIGTIRRLRYRGRPLTDEDPELATRSLQNRMLYHLGLALLDEQRWSDLTRILTGFDLSQANDRDWWFWLVTHAWQDRASAGDWDRARFFFEQQIETASQFRLGAKEQAVLAQGAYRILRDETRARQLLADVQQPPIATDVLPRLPTLEPFLQRFRLNRLLFAFGNRRSPREIVPDPASPEHEGLVYFERALCVVARIWAAAWRGRTCDPATVVHEATPLLRLFQRQPSATHRWTSWYYLERVRGEFYSLLVEAAAQHGADAIDALSEAFVQEWHHPNSSPYWPTEVRRAVLLALARAGKPKDWIIGMLHRLESLMIEGKDVTGRLEESSRQAQAWLEVNDLTSARRLLDQALRLSLGVGYRKDYQFSDWIHWLMLMNEVDSEHAAERVLWFARAILALEDITEGEASRLAANELLGATFRWSPRRGVSLFRFFVDHKIVHYEEALVTILKDVLEHRDISTVLLLSAIADFLLAFATRGDPDLSAGLIKETRARRGHDQALAAADYLLSRADTIALPSARRRWRRGIALAFDELGLDLRLGGLSDEDRRPDRDEGQGAGLRLRDGLQLALEEVRSRAASLTGLEALLEAEAVDSYFNWEPLIRQVAGSLDAEGALRLAKRLSGKLRSANALAALSERLSALSKSGAAWELGLQALQASSEWGWSRWADGGSRLSAFRALITADTTKGRSLAYETLARDGGGGAGNLDEILPLLTDHLPTREIWQEVQQYVTVLFERFPLPPDQPEDFGVPPTDDTPSRAVGDLIALHIDHPSTLVAHASQRSCTELLLRDEPSIRQAVLELLNDSESYQEHILPVLEAVALKAPSCLAAFRAQIVRSSQSTNYGIRLAARDICECLGWEFPPLSPSRNLPTIYDLTLPPTRSDLIADRPILSEFALPDTHQPQELLSPFTFQLDAIADLARIPKVNIYHRAAQIMHALAPEQSWSAAAENRLRSILDSSGLRFPFRRPRAVIARRAMFHVVAELLDAGRLTMVQAAEIEAMLRFYDPQLLLIPARRRPAAVPPVPRRERYSERNEEWIERVDESRTALKQRTAEGRMILAEQTTLRILDWGLPTENRLADLRAGSAPRADDTADRFFYNVLPGLVEEYPTLGVGGDPPPLIIRNNAYMFDTWGATWIALNPFVGEQLGWRPAGEGLFTWEDMAGRRVVETVWWADGLIGHCPPHFDDEVGEGWLVLADKEACAAIRERFPRCKRYIRIERHLSREADRLARVFEQDETLD